VTDKKAAETLLAKFEAKQVDETMLNEFAASLEADKARLPGMQQDAAAAQQLVDSLQEVLGMIEKNLDEFDAKAKAARYAESPGSNGPIASCICVSGTTMWTKDRRDELAKLLQLLQDAKDLNNSSGTLDKLLKIKAVADELTTVDHANDRTSFVKFLVGEVAAARA